MPDDNEKPGADILVEVRSQTGRGSQLTGAGSRLPRFIDRVDDLGASLNAIALRMREQFEALSEAETRSWDLSQISLTFSLDLQAQAGVVIARASTSATFEASLTWTRGKSAAS